MQTKLLLAALAANTVNAATTKALVGERTQEVQDRLLDIYTRCKAHFEGVSFEVKQVPGGQYAGRVNFSLEEADDCPDMDISIKTSAENADGSKSKVISERTLTIEEAKKLTDGKNADFQLFSNQDGYFTFVVELRAVPSNLECGLPFDVVVDRTANELECEAVFSDLKGWVSCKGGVCAHDSALNNNFSYEVSGWNNWACPHVDGKMTATNCLTGDFLGETYLENYRVRDSHGNFYSFTSEGTYEPVCWSLEFFDQGKKIGELIQENETPHPPCQVKFGAVGGTATPNEAYGTFDLTLNVNQTATYTCGAIERKYNVSDCTTVLMVHDDDLDENHYSTFTESVEHSLAYADLPQKYCATVSYVEQRLGPVGEINFDFEGNNACSFSIQSIQLTNERQADYSQTFSVSGYTSQSLSCPKFDLEVQYWGDNDSLLQKIQMYAVDAGEFTNSINIPEMFGNVSARVVMTPTEGGAREKQADSASVNIQPEQCYLSVTSTSEQPTFDRESLTVTTREQFNLSYTDHWCHLDNITCHYSSEVRPAIAAAEEYEWGRHDAEFADLTGLGYIRSRTFGNVDFGYASGLTCKYTAHENFPDQYNYETESYPDAMFHIGQCTLHGLELSLGTVYSPEHPIKEPNYKVTTNLTYNIDIEQFNNCPELLVTVDFQFSEDGYDFESVGSLSGNQNDFAEGIHNDAKHHFDEFAEEKDGYYRMCSQIQKVEPSLYEKPITACSNAVRHRPICEYEINHFAQVSTRPSGDNSGYVHDFEFDGFQNKWCGDMVVNTQVTDPYGGVHEESNKTVSGEAFYFSIFQDDNFVNGNYSANLNWGEIDSVNFKSESTNFSITEAGNWCSETLGFYSEWDFVQDSEKWNYVEFLSHSSDFQYAYICEDPVFTIDFDDHPIEQYPLAYHSEEAGYYEVKFPVDNPVSGTYKATVSINTNPDNGGSKVVEVTKEAYEPVCYISEVSHERLGEIHFGKNTATDPNILTLSLFSKVQGNCGDGILYTLDYTSTPWNVVDGVRQEKQTILGSLILSADDHTKALSFNPAFGHTVDVTYTVDAINAPRHNFHSQDSYQDYYTVAEQDKCVMDIQVQEVSFGENNDEMLEASYDISCTGVQNCFAPQARIVLKNTEGTTIIRELRPDEIADCIRDTTRVTFVEENEAGCFNAFFSMMDEYEPRIMSLSPYSTCKPNRPPCHTKVLSLVKKGHRFNFDETKAAVDLHFQLQAHEERYCGYQMARFEFKDQHDQVRAVHELDMTQINKAKADEGFTMTFELDNDPEITYYSAQLTYYDDNNTGKAHAKQINQVFTYTENTECRMEVESFTLESLTRVEKSDDYEAVFEIMTHVTEACRGDFEASINFIHNDEYVENFVLTDPSAIYRVRNDGRESEIKLIVKELGDLTGEFYGQIEMNAGGKYHISDSASLVSLQ